MISAIIEGALTKLKEAGLDIMEFNYKDLIDKTINLNRPAINAIINQSSIKPIARSTYAPVFKHDIRLSLLLLIHYIGSTAEKTGKRKSLIYDLIESIHHELTNEDFGLGLENPLFPSGWRNITTFELAEAQYQLYQIDFNCSFVIEPDSKDTVIGDLRTILAQYSLEPDSFYLHEDLISLT